MAVKCKECRWGAEQYSLFAVKSWFCNKEPEKIKEVDPESKCGGGKPKEKYY